MLATAQPAAAQATTRVDPSLYAGLAWRNLGPFRGGRVSAVSGAVGQPGVYYMGTPGGGLWKTTSGGQTWFPVFDAIRSVSSIGAVEVAPSDPNIVYVGTGDMISGGTLDQGNG
ncbi:MAG: glycosyl hydrolase, partial [Kofleriaceae bacterium]